MHTNKRIHKKHKGTAAYGRGGKGSARRKEKKGREEEERKERKSLTSKQLTWGTEMVFFRCQFLPLISSSFVLSP